MKSDTDPAMGVTTSKPRSTAEAVESVTSQSNRVTNQVTYANVEDKILPESRDCSVTWSDSEGYESTDVLPPFPDTENR